MVIDIPDKIFRPCSTCNDDTCVFYGSKNTHEICTDYKDKRLTKAIKEIKKLYTEWENISEEAKLESNPFDAVLNILQRNIGERSYE